MPKFFAVELTTVAIVQVEDDQTAADAEQWARDNERDILRDVMDMDVSAAGEVTRQSQLSLHGWDGMCIPYGGDGNTRLQELLPSGVRECPAPPCGKTPCPPGQVCKSPFCRAAGVTPSPAPQREVPPGKWKVDMPDGTYGRMPGDPPGPASVCAVIGGYVYDVEPRTGMLIASAPPTGYRLQKFNEEMQVGPRPWEIPGPHQPNPPLPRDLGPTVPRGEGNSTAGVPVRSEQSLGAHPPMDPTP